MKYRVTKNHIIHKRLKELKLKENDLCQLLGITSITLNDWINKPYKIRLGDVMILAGYLKLEYDFLIYYLLRCKSPAKAKKDRDEEMEQIEYIRNRNKRYKFLD